jgi:hypothetical protein
MGNGKVSSRPVRVPGIVPQILDRSDGEEDVKACCLIASLEYRRVFCIRLR